MSSEPDRLFLLWRDHGDAEALGRVFDLIAPRLLRVAVHFVGDVAAAEDLVQSTFVTAMERATTFDAAREFEPWISGILANHARDLRRASRRVETVPDLSARLELDLRTPLDSALATEESAALAKAVDGLPEPYRAVMILRLRHGLKDADIAHVLDRSPGAVRVQLHRGRELLKKVVPAGLVASVLAVSAGRGLAAVKTGVLSHSSSVSAAASGALVFGGIAVGKKTLVAALVVLVVAIGVGITLSVHRGADGGRSWGQDEYGYVHEILKPPASAAVASLSVSDVRSPVSSTGALAVSGRIVNRTYSGLTHAVESAAACTVTMRVEAGEAAAATKIERELVTDSEGRFACELDLHDSLHRRIEIKTLADERYVETAWSRDLSGEERDVRDVVLERVPKGVVRGVTLGPHGEPLAGVVVRRVGVFSNNQLDLRGGSSTQSTHDPAEIRAVSGQDGRFEYLPPSVKSEMGGKFLGELPGWSPLEADRLLLDEQGMPKPVTIVLAPQGTLTVHVVDSKGVPVAGVDVEPNLSSLEPRLAPFDNLRWRDEFFRATDANGVARFPALWRSKRLSVTVYDMGNSRPARWMRNGTAVFDESAPDVEPIVIGANGALELFIRRDPVHVIRGRIVRADGTPAAKAGVGVSQASAPMTGTDRFAIATKADESGTFVLRVPWSEGIGLLRLVAAEKDLTHIYATLPPRSVDFATGVLFDPRTWNTETALELALQPLASIAGFVHCDDNSIPRGHVAAVPAGAPSRLEPTTLGQLAAGEINEQGAFRIANLPVGSYDLYVVRTVTRHGSLPLDSRCFPGVVSGASGLNLTLRSTPDVRVRVRATSQYGDIASLHVLRGRRIERDTASRAPNEAPSTMTIRCLTGLTADSDIGFTGSAAGKSTSAHEDTYESQKCNGTEAQCSPMEAGRYDIGVVAKLADGRKCLPMATGFVDLKAGDYDFTFEVVPLTRVEGRVTGIEARNDLELELTDSSGRLIPFPSPHILDLESLRALAVRDDGYFLLASVPLGKFTLRIGTHAQLLRGEALFQQDIEITPDMSPLELRAH